MQSQYHGEIKQIVFHGVLCGYLLALALGLQNFTSFLRQNAKHLGIRAALGP